MVAQYGILESNDDWKKDIRHVLEHLGHFYFSVSSHIQVSWISVSPVPAEVVSDLFCLPV